MNISRKNTEMDMEKNYDDKSVTLSHPTHKTSYKLMLLLQSI